MKRLPIGSQVPVRACTIVVSPTRPVFHTCDASCVEENVVATVVRHGRDTGGIYTRVRYANGAEENWHRDSLKPVQSR